MIIQPLTDQPFILHLSSLVNAGKMKSLVGIPNDYSEMTRIYFLLLAYCMGIGVSSINVHLN